MYVCVSCTFIDTKFLRFKMAEHIREILYYAVKVKVLIQDNMYSSLYWEHHLWLCADFVVRVFCRKFLRAFKRVERIIFLSTLCSKLYSMINVEFHVHLLMSYNNMCQYSLYRMFAKKKAMMNVQIRGYL